MQKSPQYQRLIELLGQVPDVPEEKRQAIADVIRTADSNFILPIDQVSLNDAILIYRLVDLALKSSETDLAGIKLPVAGAV